MGAQIKQQGSCMYCGTSGIINENIFQGLSWRIKTKGMEREPTIVGALGSDQTPHAEICNECLAIGLEACAKGLRGIYQRTNLDKYEGGRWVMAKVARRPK